MQDEPDYESPCGVGDVVLVDGEMRVVDSAGNSVEVIHAGMECRVTGLAWDAEWGWRYVGTPASSADLADVRQQATAERDADWYRRHRPWDAAGIERAERAQAAFDPSVVVFSEHDLEMRAVWA